ncbi:Holliday junction resolvase RuvX [Rubripirellula obstinata]|uniref:Holliday junction resolvase RuvX n=1 Tax=Rubripirellula obstinata TaxID=406547 RepID=UPI003B82EB03
MFTQSKILNDPFPSSGRIAAIDFGSVRIGIAVCDPDWILASPLEIHPAKDWQDDGDYYRQLAKLEKLAGFVVGLPIHLDGGESQKSAECREFAKWLHEATGLPTRLFDERFTTADANRRIASAGYSRKKKKDRLDAVAALVLLESFLEACRYRDEIAGEDIDADPVGGDGIDDEG